MWYLSFPGTATRAKGRRVRLGRMAPDLYDIDMLIELAARADPGFSSSPAIEGCVYSLYS